jgi:citrate lyase subunit alpha / citrate CoA-transferase
LRIAEFVARFLRDAGTMRNGFSFQAGAGGIALAFVGYLKQMMKEAGVKARFVRGGSTKYLANCWKRALPTTFSMGRRSTLAAYSRWPTTRAT